MRFKGRFAIVAAIGLASGWAQARDLGVDVSHFQGSTGISQTSWNQMAADGKKFVNIVGTGLVSVWVAPDGDAARAVQLPLGNIGSFSALGNSLAWTPDGQIVFASADVNEINLWITDPSGTSRRQLTSNAGINVSPVISPDGTRFVFPAKVADGREQLAMRRLDQSGDELSCYVVEVCPGCSWNHLVRRIPLGGRRRRS